MKRNLLIVTITLLSTSQVLQSQSIKDLDFLIGKWEVSEVVYPGTDKEYIEKGTRTCEYILQDTYIQCTTNGNRHGKDRSYQWSINFDKKTKHFIYTSTWSDYDFRGTYEIRLNAEKSELKVIPVYEPGEDAFSRSTINFADKDHLIWTGWNSAFEGEPKWVKLYVEEAKRVK